MTRRMTMAGTALCAILVVAVQSAAAAQTKAPAKAPVKAAAAKAAPAKALPAKALPAKAVAPADPASITLTGCLQANGPKYMLTDTEGPKAEKGRSWKTGFITKKSKDVEVVASSASVKLGDFRGHKVSVVGVRDGEAHLKARTIKQLVGSCS
jgi:hypothetical protein